MRTGGCFCGYIRYEVSGTPFFETNCHCSICRRTSGAPYVTWFTVLKDGLRMTGGRPSRLQSTEKGQRSFCPRCGTPVTFQSADFPEYLDVTTCSLDAPDELPPQDHTQVATKLPWVSIDDGLPRFDAARPES